VGILIEAIITRYKNFMEEHYPNQGIAAEALGISRSHLNKIINRRDNPSMALLLRMEEVMQNGELCEPKKNGDP
jgi:plasmid maintenance system antidote protein VapI